MSPELQDKVMAQWHTMHPREERACGCIWVRPYAKQPYRSVHCAEHAPVVQALMEVPHVR